MRRPSFYPWLKLVPFDLRPREQSVQKVLGKPVLRAEVIRSGVTQQAFKKLTRFRVLLLAQ